MHAETERDGHGHGHDQGSGRGRGPGPGPGPDRVPHLERDLDRIAHEVINAVAVIGGRAQLTRRRIEKTDDLSREQIAADLRAIEEQAARAGVLVEACRSFANGKANETG